MYTRISNVHQENNPTGIEMNASGLARENIVPKNNFNRPTCNSVMVKETRQHEKKLDKAFKSIMHYVPTRTQQLHPRFMKNKKVNTSLEYSKARKRFYAELQWIGKKGCQVQKPVRRFLDTLIRRMGKERGVSNKQANSSFQAGKNTIHTNAIIGKMLNIPSPSRSLPPSRAPKLNFTKLIGATARTRRPGRRGAPA